MTSEHVKLSPEEQVYAHGNLLQSQLDIINSSKRLVNYKNLRKREFKLKIEIKTRISEVRDELENIDKLLPRAKMKEKIHKEITIEKERDVLQDEAEEIRKKLQSLRTES